MARMFGAHQRTEARSHARRLLLLQSLKLERAPGSWKLHLEKTELYNLKDDIGEAKTWLRQ